MRRIILGGLGVLELGVAGLLGYLAWQIPGPGQVAEQVGRVEQVGRQTSSQLQRLQQQLQQLRDNQPEARKQTEQLQQQLRFAAERLRGQPLDYEMIQTVHVALGDLARGLDSLQETLSPEGVSQIGAGVLVLADFLENKVAPAAERMAADLEKSTEALRADAQRLSDLLRAAPLDLKVAREIHDSLGKFGQGLERLNETLKTHELDAMREGFKGLHTALSAGAGQVDKLANYSYPVVTFQGVKPSMERRPFWPEGGTIAEGMRKAADGATAAGKELDTVAADLPKLRSALLESRRIAEQTREALGTALKQQDKVEPLLKNVPEHAARLAEELPQLGAGLAKVLRDVARLKNLAGLLHKVNEGIDVAVQRWPELRQNLARSAVLLRAAQKQMQFVLDHRGDYETSAEQTAALVNNFASALPLFTSQIDGDIQEQERSLGDLGGSIDRLTEALPETGHGVAHLLRTTALLLALAGVCVALHGGYLLFGPRK